MKAWHRFAAAGLWLALALPAAAAGEGSGAPPPQTIVFKVAVDAQGRVQSAEAVDPQAPAAYLQAGKAYAGKLVFSPARKGGVAVPSQTNLNLVIAAEPAGDGKYALKLRRATNGPGVVEVGKMEPPKYQGRRGGATIVVSVDVDAQGKPDMDSFKTESTQLRDDNSFAEARYVDAIRASVRRSTFAPDTVAGAPVRSRLTLPYRFGMGGAKPKPGEDEDGRGKRPATPDPSEQPVLRAVSNDPTIELPSIDFKAPASGA